MSKWKTDNWVVSEYNWYDEVRSKITPSKKFEIHDCTLRDGAHVVDFTEGGFTVHDKATGKVLRHLTQRELPVRSATAEPSSPQKESDTRNAQAGSASVFWWPSAEQPRTTA